ncbi:nuclear transport factor 2 family protein [Vulcanococcus limneticus]|uniref:nuclear transport factor 2 family protein n=1 Tax=Vulcanococcus limneticus TaxID=2170428 RepID=UPI00398BF228
MSTENSEIEAVEQALRSAMLASDLAALDGLVDDALLFVGPDGSVLSKDSDLSLYRSGEQRITTLDFQDQQIRVGDAVASVTVLAFVSGVHRGHAFEGWFRYLRVWHRTPTGWRVIAGSVSTSQG